MEILSREFHTEEVIEVMQTDPALIASVLKKCNTAFFSQRGGVTSLKQAIQLLGTSMIMSMVLELTIGENLNKGLQSYGVSASNLQKHSFCTAVCSKELTQFCGILPFTIDTAFTAGLLHDIGKIAIDEVLTAQGVNLAESKESTGKTTLELEHEFIETNHGEVGAMVLEWWKFPEFFCEAIGQHHIPLGRNQLAHLLNIANQCAHSIEVSDKDSTVIKDLPIESLSALAITYHEVEKASQCAQHSIKERYQPLLN